jgi:hypothetical protein
MRRIVLCDCWLPLPCGSVNIWEVDLNASVSCDGLSFHAIAWTFKLLADQHYGMLGPNQPTAHTCCGITEGSVK